MKVDSYFILSLHFFINLNSFKLSGAERLFCTGFISLSQFYIICTIVVIDGERLESL